MKGREPLEQIGYRFSKQRRDTAIWMGASLRLPGRELRSSACIPYAKPSSVDLRLWLGPAAQPQACQGVEARADTSTESGFSSQFFVFPGDSCEGGAERWTDLNNRASPGVPFVRTWGPRAGSDPVSKPELFSIEQLPYPSQRQPIAQPPYGVVLFPLTHDRLYSCITWSEKGFPTTQFLG